MSETTTLPASAHAGPEMAALAPFFRGVKRPLLVLSSQVISASSFIVPYLRFERETGGAGRDAACVVGSRRAR